MEPVPLVPSVELLRARERLDAVGAALHSEESSEQIETNHPMT